MAQGFVKFRHFVEPLGLGLVNLEAQDVFVVLTNIQPDADNDTVLADITQIPAGNGYVTDGESLGPTKLWIQSAVGVAPGCAALVKNDLSPTVFTAASGPMAPFQWFAIYVKNATNSLIAYGDYGSLVSLDDGNTFVIDWSTTFYILNAQAFGICSFLDLAGTVDLRVSTGTGDGITYQSDPGPLLTATESSPLYLRQMLPCPQIAPDDESFTVSFWYKCSAGNSCYLLLAGNSPGGASHEVFFLFFFTQLDGSENEIIIEISGVDDSFPTTHATTTTNPEGLHLGIGCYRHSTNELEISIDNGVPVTIAGAAPGPYTWDEFSPRMEISLNSGFSPASIGQTCIWKGRALSPADRTELYNGGSILPIGDFSPDLLDALTTIWTFAQAVEPFDDFTWNLGRAKFDFSQPVTFQISDDVMSLAAADATALTFLAPGNGYTGSVVIPVTSYTYDAGTGALTGGQATIAASGGDIGPFRYCAVMQDPWLIVRIDLGTEVTIADGQVFLMRWNLEQIIFRVS